MENEQPAMTTDGRRPSWMFKQVDRLVAASEAEAELAYLHRLMALCSLPRTDPGDVKEFSRVNGPYTLGMVAGLHNKLPYGNIPRLLVGLDMHGSHADTKPRVVSRQLAFRFS